MSFGTFVLGIGITALAGLYLLNFLRLIESIKRKEFTIITGIRAVGVPVFWIGVIMGLIKNEQPTQ